MSLSVDALDIKKRIEGCKTLQEVETIRLDYLGKKGFISSKMKLLGKLSIEERKLKGQELNKLKILVEETINNKKINIESKEIQKKLQNENIDVTLPTHQITNGKIHPISQTIFSIIEIFGNLTPIDLEWDSFDFSTHAGHADIVEFAEACGAKDVVVYHTDPNQARPPLVEALEKNGHTVHQPKNGESYVLQ